MKKGLLASIVAMVACFSAFGTDYYWAGGSGVFSSTLNWEDENGVALSSIPTINDNVYIDAPSATITFTSNNDFYANDLNILSNCTLLFNDISLDRFFIQGDIIFVENMTTTYNTGSGIKWILFGPNDHTLDTKGIDMKGIEMDDVNARMILASDLYTNQDIDLFNGDLVSNGFEISCNIFDLGDCAQGCTTQTLDLGSSTIEAQTIFEVSEDHDTLIILGTSTLISSRLKLGTGNTFHNIIAPMNSSVIEGNGTTMQNLSIDSYNTFSIETDIQILGDFEVTRGGLKVTFDQDEGVNFFEVVGDITLPFSDGDICYNLTRFQAIGGTSFVFQKPSGIFEIARAHLKNIGVGAGTSFNALESIISEHQEDWNMITPPTSNTLYWIGGTGDWDDATHWSFLSGGTSANCIPHLTTNVIFDENSFVNPFNEVNIMSSGSFACRSFNWSVPESLETTLLLGFNGYSSNALAISKNFSLNTKAIIDGGGYFRMIGTGTSNIKLSGTEGIRCYLDNSSGTFILRDSMIDSRIYLDAGTFDHNNKHMDLESFDCLSKQPKHVIFREGDIFIDHLKFGFGGSENASFDPGKSHIVAKSIIWSDVDSVYNFTLTDFENSFYTDFYDLIVNKLVLDGAGEVTFSNVHADSLIFLQDGTIVNLGANIFINEHISSMAPGTDPPIIDGFYAFSTITFGNRNMCVSGPIEFSSVNTNGGGIFHAPESINLGSNLNIDFQDYAYNDSLFWIGGTGFIDDNRWSYKSGRCPDNNANINVAEYLVVDNLSLLEGDTIFVPNPTNVENLVLLNDTTSAHFILGNQFRTKSTVLDSGRMEIQKFESLSNPAKFLVDQFMHVKNGSSLKFYDNEITIGIIPTSYSEISLMVDENSIFSGPNATLRLAGSSFNPSFSTVNWHPNATIIMGNGTIRNVGSPANAFPISLALGSHLVGSLEMKNMNGPNQKIRITQNCFFRNIDSSYGELIILNGRIVKVL